MEEDFRIIKGFSKYRIEKSGKIYSFTRKCYKKDYIFHKNSNSAKVCLTGDNRKTDVKNVEVLMWEAFNGVIPENYLIFHKDNNPLNNALSNLDIIEVENAKSLFKEDPSLIEKFSYLYMKIPFGKEIYEIDPYTYEIFKTHRSMGALLKSLERYDFITLAKLKRIVKNKIKTIDRYFVFMVDYEEFIKEKLKSG